MLSKFLIQFPGHGWGCVPSMLFDLRLNYGGGNGNNDDLLQKVPRMHCHTQCPNPTAGHHQPMPLPKSPGNSQASLGQSLLGSLLLPPGSWCTQGIACALQESVSPVLCKFCGQIPLACIVKFPGDSQFLCQIPRLGNLSPDVKN